MAEANVDAIEKYHDELITELSCYVDSLSKYLVLKNLLSRENSNNLKAQGSALLKLKYILNECVKPKLDLGNLDLFDGLIDFMNSAKDSNLQLLASKITEEIASAVPTQGSQQATEPSQTTTNGKIIIQLIVNCTRMYISCDNYISRHMVVCRVAK